MGFAPPLISPLPSVLKERVKKLALSMERIPFCFILQPCGFPFSDAKEEGLPEAENRNAS
jgi:hypothetical protein